MSPRLRLALFLAERPLNPDYETPLRDYFPQLPYAQGKSAVAEELVRMHGDRQLRSLEEFFVASLFLGVPLAEMRWRWAGVLIMPMYTEINSQPAIINNLVHSSLAYGSAWTFCFPVFGLKCIDRTLPLLYRLASEGVQVGLQLHFESQTDEALEDYVLPPIVSRVVVWEGLGALPPCCKNVPDVFMRMSDDVERVAAPYKVGGKYWWNRSLQVFVPVV